MTYPTREAPEAKLIVTNFKTKDLSPELTDWRLANPVAIAESCNRQVWFGTEDTFVNYPEADENKIHVLRGGEAYAFLLKLLTGLDSPKKGETNIKGQFYMGWGAYKEDHPILAKELEPILQHLKADSRSIQSQILGGHKMQEHGLVARDLSGRKKGAEVLLVGHLSRHGNIGEYGEKIARTLNGRASRAERLMVTHPDADIAEKIFQELKALQKPQGRQGRGIIEYTIEKIDFNRLSEAFELSDFSYIDIPMGEYPEADEFIVNAWQTRGNRDSKLTHMRGNPRNMALSDSLWESAQLDNYISPEDIRTKMFERGRFNKELGHIAEQAFQFCAKLRLGGKSPSDRKVRDFARDHRATSQPPKAEEIPVIRGASEVLIPQLR